MSREKRKEKEKKELQRKKYITNMTKRGKNKKQEKLPEWEFVPASEMAQAVTQSLRKELGLTILTHRVKEIWVGYQSSSRSKL